MLDNEEMRDLGLWHVGLFGVGQWKGVGKGLAAVSIGTKGRPAGAIVSVPGPSENTQRRWPESAPEGLIDVWEIPEARDEQLVRVIAAGGADVARRSGARHLGPARITDERVSVPPLTKGDERPSYRYGLTVALTESWLKLLMLGGGAHTLVCLTVQRELFGDDGMPSGTNQQLQKATAAMSMALVVNETADDDEPVTVEQAKDALSELSETQLAEQKIIAACVLASLVEKPLATAPTLAKRAIIKAASSAQGCQSLPAVTIAIGRLLAVGSVRRCAGTDELPVYEATPGGIAIAEASRPKSVKVVCEGGALSIHGKALLTVERLQTSLALHRYTSGARVTEPQLAALVTGLAAQDADGLPEVTPRDLVVHDVYGWFVDKRLLAWAKDCGTELQFDITDECLRAHERA